MTFHVVVTFCNAGPYLLRCIKSIQQQRSVPWQCWVYDDCSVDDSYERVASLIRSDSRFRWHYNTYKHWMVGNLLQFRSRLDVHDEDVVVQVDGDDWLPDAEVLSRIDEAYSDGNTWLTYGNFLRVGASTQQVGYCRKVVAAKDVRALPWTSSAIRTFKVFLLRAIHLDDLLWTDGEFIPAAGDLALMFPMIEMAGDERSKCLSDINYCYNVTNPYNDFRVRKMVQQEIDLHLRRKPPYSLLRRDPNEAH